MKKIEAIIQPFKLRDVKRALSELGIKRMTVTDVKEFGRHDDLIAIYRGHEHLMDFQPHLKLEVAVTDEQLVQAVNAIAEAGETGKEGAGEIFIYPIEQAVRIGIQNARSGMALSRSC